jgi:Asparagine synthase
LQFGHLYDDRTFFPQIRKIKANAVLRCRPDGSIDSLPKKIPDLSELPQRSFDSLMQDFATAVQNETVSVDITGGADSRLLAAALAYYGLPFEMATGGRPGIPDVRIGAKVAETLGRPFYPTYHSAARTNWDELVHLTEGMFDISKLSRLMQLSRDRKSRGVTLSVSGACGELFREIWWMQDFPFYARRKARIDRLFALRIAPYPFDDSLLAERYRVISKTYREKVLQRIWKFAVPSNGKSYDRVYYYFELPSAGGCFVTSSVNLLKVGLPYVDHDVIRIGYNLPPMQRVFSRFHRRMMTRYSPNVAKLASTEAGVSLSSGFLPMSADLSRYLLDRSKRLTKKVGQQVLRKTFFQESSDDPKITGALTQALAKAKSTEVLADHGIFDRAIAPNALPARYLGRVFALARLIERLETARQPARRGDVIEAGMQGAVRIAMPVARAHSSGPPL